MRTLVLAVALAPLLPLLFALPQDPGEEEPEEAPPPGAVQRFRQEEQTRLEEEIQGAWLLLGFQPVWGELPVEDIQGFAVFADGYLSLTIMMRTFEPEFLGPGIQHGVQAGAHHYRISDHLTLQTASVLGFTNVNEGAILEFEPASWPREYRIELEEGRLWLQRTDGASFTFSRLDPSKFPNAAIERLNVWRGTGGMPEPPEPPSPPGSDR